MNKLIRDCPSDHDAALKYYAELCRQLSVDLYVYTGTTPDLEDRINEIYELHEWIFPLDHVDPA